MIRAEKTAYAAGLLSSAFSAPAGGFLQLSPGQFPLTPHIPRHLSLLETVPKIHPDRAEPMTPRRTGQPHPQKTNRSYSE